MSEKFSFGTDPEAHKKYRKELADNLKSTPRYDKRYETSAGASPHRRKDGLKNAKEYHRSEYGLSESRWREEWKTVQELLKSGEAKTEEEAQEMYANRILERESKITSWREADLCDPDKVPEDVLESPDRAGLLNQDIENHSLRKVNELLQENPKIAELVASLQLSNEEGVVKAQDYCGPGIEIEKKRLLNITKEQEEKVKDITSVDEQQLGLFLNELFDKGRNDFELSPHFNSPTRSGSSVICEKNLQAIFGEKIPYKTYTGSNSYEIKPFANIPERERHGIEKRSGFWIKPIYVYLDEIRTLAAYGRVDAEKLITNLRKTFALVEQRQVEKLVDGGIVKIFGAEYTRVKKELPELAEFARTLNTNYDTLQALDIENKTAIFLGNRSEQGSSGGMGMWSEVTAWHDGKIEQQNFQYRDRHSAQQDKWQLAFKNLKIENIKDEGGKMTLSISADPKREGYSTTQISFSFEKAEGNESRNELSTTEQAEFKVSVETQMAKLLSEKATSTKGREYLKLPESDADTISGYMPYENPKAIESVFDERFGNAAFVIAETIDNRSSDRQLRYEVYLAKHEQGVAQIERVFEDHAYIKSQGDPSVTGLRIFGDEIVFNTRAGEQKISIPKV